jgi:predicted PurR-regulated permease PerM
MHPDPPANTPSLQDKTFVALLVLVTLAFGWILLPFYGAVFWGIVLAIVFAPLQRRVLARLGHRHPNSAALITLAVVLLMVILPLTLVGMALARELDALYQRIQSGEVDLARDFNRIVSAMPDWSTRLLQRFGLVDIAAIQERITTAAAQGSQAIASRALKIGQNTLDIVIEFFVMLYLAYFLLRDGSALQRRVRAAIPLDPGSKRNLFAKFATVVRATVKGNIVIAVIQGTLGGIALWFLDVRGALLWGVLMAVLSLLPAIGAAIVWLPVALFLLATGELVQGFGLIAYGVLVIGLVDNLLRPVLVGNDIKMPDYLVLVSTIGGISVFGINGFVIGPMIAAMFLAAWDIFSEGRDNGPAP